MSDHNYQKFKAIFDQYQSDIFNFLNYKTGNTQVAEDILQETFIKLWENRENIKENLSIKSYLYTIANNMALNYFRHKKIIIKYQVEQQQADQDYYDTSPDRIYENRELKGRLMAAIEQLPEKTRIVFMMSRFNRLKYNEIAERLEISIKTVESHIGKALKILRKKFDE